MAFFDGPPGIRTVIKMTEDEPTLSISPREESCVGLMIAAIGVVFGDIGTSPLYALREVLTGGYGVAVNTTGILGVLSLIFWALVWVVGFKYLLFVTRADNHGEGGILALMTLVRSAVKKRRSKHLLVLLGLAGAALLYGDSMITPAVSVLSSVEGISIAHPGLTHFIVPVAIVILMLLFLIQPFGTERIGKLFGPVILVWFIVLALVGLRGIWMAPEVLMALNPLRAIFFFRDNPGVGISIFSAITLAITGAEALYADMGHFGRNTIARAWLLIAFPALVLNYFGQGGLILSHQGTLQNPFYELVPHMLLPYVIILAALASIIASQAVITAAFSISQQAISLGYLPRLRIFHTSNASIGQIYVPIVNWTVMIGVIILVCSFRSSANLAAAYGVAVTGTMLITSLLISVVMNRRWRWSLIRVLPLSLLFIAVDVLLFGSNLVKFFHGGIVPILIAIIAFWLMMSWNGGKKRLLRALIPLERSLGEFIEELREKRITRIEGQAIYLSSPGSMLPTALSRNLDHNKVIHEQIVLVTVRICDVPHLKPRERCEVTFQEQGVTSTVLKFGFMDNPDVPDTLDRFSEHLGHLNINRASWFVGRETLIVNQRFRWNSAMFRFMRRNASGPINTYSLPARQVVEIVTQVGS
ncbi:Low affinity potassium transport system protein kup [Halomonadaceae bacterium LMG 33818]